MIFFFFCSAGGGGRQEKLAVVESLWADSSSPARSPRQKLHSGLGLAAGHRSVNRLGVRSIQSGSSNHKRGETTRSQHPQRPARSAQGRRISRNSLGSLWERWTHSPTNQSPREEEGGGATARLQPGTGSRRCCRLSTVSLLVWRLQRPAPEGF